jgi:hypothetical protein
VIKTTPVEATTVKRKKSLDLPWTPQLQDEKPSISNIPTESQHKIEKDCRVKEFYNYSNVQPANHWRSAKASAQESEIETLKKIMKLLKAIAEHPALDLETVCSTAEMSKFEAIK